MHPREENTDKEKVNIRYTPKKECLIASLFVLVIVCVSIIFTYTTKASIKLQEGFSNLKNMKELHHINRNSAHITEDKFMDQTHSNHNTYNEVLKRKNTCFYLSWKNTGKLNITDLLIAENKMKRNQHSKKLTMKLKPCKRIITIGTFGGRIGNHMFRIATMLGLAYKNDITPVIPSESLLNEYIDLPNVVDFDARNMPEMFISCNKRYPEHCVRSANTTCSIILFGLMQSWKYFDGIRNIILSAFKIKNLHIINAEKFIKNVTIHNYKNVCIHVRRGDFLAKRRQIKGFAVADKSYIERAKAFFVQNYDRVQFISVSLDKKWCRTNIKDAILSPFTNPGDDLALLSLCDHAIITSGTFGWWGAWLSGGTTVYFQGYPAPGSVLETFIFPKDYYPDRWIAM